MAKTMVAVILLTFCTVACTTNNENTEHTPAPLANLNNTDEVLIRFAVNRAETVLYHDLIEQFERENPDIQIELLIIDDILNTDNAAPDPTQKLAQTADVFRSNFANPYRPGIIRDLTPFITADPSFDQTNFHPNTLPDQQDGIYLLPLSLSFNLIFYNKDAFDAADVTQHPILCQ